MVSVRVIVAGSLALLAGCVPRPAPTPQQQAPRPAPPPAPAPAPAPQPSADWRDLLLTPGSWSYRVDAAGTQALFGPAGFGASFTLRCDKSRRTISLMRQGITTGNTMTIRTSFGQRNFPLSVQTNPIPYVFSTLPVADPFFDTIAFTRGRFTVQVPGTDMLIIPAWPEPARVIEDCRS